MDTIEAPGIGHNLPPSPVEELSLELARANTDLDNRARAIEAAKERIPASIDSDDEAGKLTEFVRQCQAAIRTAEDRHDEAKRPYIDLGRTVDNFFRIITDRVASAKALAENRLTVYARKKREAQEARDREIAKAYQKFGEKPPPPTAAPVRVRSDVGGVMTQTDRWTFEIDDLAKIPLASLRAFIARDAVEKALRAYIRHHHKMTPDQIPPLKGVRFLKAEKVIVR